MSAALNGALRAALAAARAASNVAPPQRPPREDDARFELLSAGLGPLVQEARRVGKRVVPDPALLAELRGLLQVGARAASHPLKRGGARQRRSCGSAAAIQLRPPGHPCCAGAPYSCHHMRARATAPTGGSRPAHVPTRQRVRPHTCAWQDGTIWQAVDAMCVFSAMARPDFEGKALQIQVGRRADLALTES